MTRSTHPEVLKILYMQQLSNLHVKRPDRGCAQRYVVLRQHYLVGGESLINEWHAQFLAERRRSASEAARSAQPHRGSAVQLLFALRDRLKARAASHFACVMPCSASTACCLLMEWLIKAWCEF